MELIVSDRESVERGLLVRSSYVLISVRDSDARPTRVPRVSGLRGVLHLAFDDAEPTAGFVLPGKLRLMSPEQATQVVEFVKTHRETVGAIVVHCHQGMSRSPAIAAALAGGLGLDERRFWDNYSPNRHVYQLVREAAEVQR